LRDRHSIAVPVRKAHCAEPNEQLAKKVCEPGVSIAAPDARHPFSKDSGFNEGIAPERVANARMRSKEGPHCLVRNEGHLGRRKGPYIMVHNPKMQALNIGNVAGYMEGENLPVAAGQNLVAIGKALEDNTALRRAVSFSDYILVPVELPQRQRKAA
jgi:hypothetical protein